MGIQTGLESFALGLDPTVIYVAITGVGVAFAYFGLRIYEALLAIIGGVVGGGAGAAFGGLYLPRVMELGTSGPWVQIGLALVCTLIGIKLGSSLLLLFNRLAVMFSGFVATGLAAFVVLVGQNLQRAPEVAQSATALQAQEALLSPATLQDPVVLVFVAGVVGAVLAWKFYVVIISFTTSVFGAAALGVVVPLWLQSEQVVDPGAIVAAAPLPNVWFLATFVTGFLFQLGVFHFGLLDSTTSNRGGTKNWNP